MTTNQKTCFKDPYPILHISRCLVEDIKTQYAHLKLRAYKLPEFWPDTALSLLRNTDLLPSMEDALKTLEVAAAAAQKGDITEEYRVRLLAAASNLVTSLQRPEETVMRETFWMGRYMAMRVLHDLSIFDHIFATGRITSVELAEMTGADRTLIERFLRVMTASGYVVELDEATYGPNRLTEALTDRRMKGMVECIFDGGMETMARIPAYLAGTGYKNPEDQVDGPLQYRYDAKGQDLFQILHARPNLLSAFSAFFEGDGAGRPDWVDWFPVQEKLLNDPDRPITPDSILYVDVAGGRGYDLLAFKKKFHDVQGKYYLYDLPQVVEEPTLDLGHHVQSIGFNFFQDRVVYGSRIYFIKHVLHDWSDEKCLAILSNVTASMRRGYSQLIIEEMVLPPTGATLLPTLFDMQMITFVAAMERTEKQWSDLLDRAGLVVDGVHLPPGDGAGIIVTQLK